MAPLNPATKQQLIDHWLPRIRALKDQRKPIMWIMLVIIIAFTVVSLLLLAYLVIADKLDLNRLGIVSVLLIFPINHVHLFGRATKLQ